MGSRGECGERNATLETSCTASGPIFLPEATAAAELSGPTVEAMTLGSALAASTGALSKVRALSVGSAATQLTAVSSGVGGTDVLSVPLPPATGINGDGADVDLLRRLCEKFWNVDWCSLLPGRHGVLQLLVTRLLRFPWKSFVPAFVAAGELRKEKDDDDVGLP